MKLSFPTHRRIRRAPAAQPQPRWSRVVLFLCLIIHVEVALTYLISWIEPPRQVAFMPITVSAYQARPLAACLATGAEPTFLADDTLFVETLRPAMTRQAILQAFDALARRGGREPIVVYLGALAIQADEGDIYVLPGDAAPDDAWTWIRLRDLLVKLKASTAARKLLVLDLMPPADSSRLGNVYNDLADAIGRALRAVPDADRWVLASCSSGQTTHVIPERGQTVFAYYFQQALLGHADGWGDTRDGRVNLRELTAYVKNHVERWSWHNCMETQTPMLFGAGADFTLVAVDPACRTAPAATPAARAYPAALAEAWKARDDAYRQGLHRYAPRLFQQQQALLRAAETAWRAGCPEPRLRKQWLDECERIQTALTHGTKEVAHAPADAASIAEPAKKMFASWWRRLQEQAAGANPDEAERIKLRRIDELRGQLAPADLDAVVFDHAVNDIHLDPGNLRLYDRLLHPTPETTPRTARTLRLRQLADLAMRVEVFAWPRDLVETVLRATELAEKAERTPALPGYETLLDEPANNRHAGEVRLWTRGFSNLDDARQRLAVACEQFERLARLDAEWRRDQQLLDQALAELPGYLAYLEETSPLRAAWMQATAAAKSLDEKLRTPAAAKMSWLERMDSLTAQLSAAAPQAQALKQHLHALAEPFSRDEVVRLERKCRSPGADAETLRTVEAVLKMPGPALHADDRVALWQAADTLARRLHEETLALDRQEASPGQPTFLIEPRVSAREDEYRLAVWRTQAHLALLELAGVPEEHVRPVRQQFERAKKDAQTAAWCDLGTMLQRLAGDVMPECCRQASAWQERERLAWLLPPLDRFTGIDDGDLLPAVRHALVARERHQRWLKDYDRYLARDYLGLNLESPGIVAAREYYGKSLHAPGGGDENAYVRLKDSGAGAPLTDKQPYAHAWLEVTRVMPAGKFGPLELLTHRVDDAWLAISPEASYLSPLRPADEPRSLTNRVPLKMTRIPTADRTGLPAPSGFLVEARFEGRSYHHLIVTPLPRDSREVQIYVNDEPGNPEASVSAISVRPGKAKQTFCLYVKNVTNRARKVHVDVYAGDVTLLKTRVPMTLTPDGVARVPFEEGAPARIAELHGALQVQVFDDERQKVLETKTIPVAIMPPSDYVRVAQIAYQPGFEATNRLVAQVEPTKAIAGPAIVAELVLPARRIPGLLAVGGGTLQVELPTQAKSSRLLSAEKIRIAGDDEEGPVYLNIDGVPRAFVYRTTFSRGGDANVPRRDDRPAVRLGAPSSIMAGVNYLVDLEVDNAPPGARLEVALGRMIGPGFKAELTREFADARKQKIGVEGAKDGLVFDASIQDWSATFDTRSIVGSRLLRARLLTSAGKEIAQASQTVVIDNSPPLARMLPPPSQVKRGSIVNLQAEAADPESGVSQVFFFVGRPAKGEAPPGVARVSALASNLNFTLWSAPLLVPADHRGPLAVSVCVVNNAGMASVDAATIEVLDHEPGKTGLGQILGKVFEGPRPQPNLTVVLTDEAGRQLARTATKTDGTYVFEKVAPGHYRVLCVKPESQRRAVQGVIVEPDRTSKTDLSLSL